MIEVFKAKAAGRVERWVARGSVNGSGNWDAAHRSMNGLVEPIHLMEVLPGERVISREELARAFSQAFTMPGNTYKQMDPTLFEAMAKALGFAKAAGEGE